MTKLVVHELITTLSQPFTVNDQTTLKLKGIRPYLYNHNNPAGIFTLALKYAGNVVDSNTFTSLDLKNALATTNNYMHLFYRIYFEKNPAIHSGDYELELSSTGYTFDEDSYLGWVSMHEDLINNITYTPTDDRENPLSFQLWGYKWQLGN